VRARRWDVTAANINTAISSLGTMSAEAINTFDASDERAIEQTYGPGGTKQNVYVFDSLELRRTEAVTTGSPPVTDYPLDKWTEVPYLFVSGQRLARIAYHDTDPEIGGNETHVFLELGDHLGSTSAVLDKVTGELVEKATWQPYGAAESDYRSSRWNQFREEKGFTGKEEDVNVGLTYFGKRFLSPYLNRWVSADPLAIHAPGEADANLYAYVRGRALQAVDPLGLQEMVNDEKKSAVRQFVEGVFRGAAGAVVDSAEGAVNTVMPAGDTPPKDGETVPPTLDASGAKANVPTSDAGQIGFATGYLATSAVMIWVSVRGMVKAGSPATKAAPAAPKEPTVEIYRGVNKEAVPAMHADALKGVVKPRSPDWKFWEQPKATPFEHNNMKGKDIFSPYTSWTHDPVVAEHFATWPKGEGVVLTARVPASRLVRSPNTKAVNIPGKGAVSEAEVLIRNALKAQGVEVVPAKK
jgi:RHS repeat-associated protein